MNILRAIPTTVIPLILFNLVAIIFGPDVWDGHIFTVTLLSGGIWTFTLGELMILLGLVFLFVEVLNSARPGENTIVNHVLSTIVLLIYVVEFIAVPFAARSVFFILTAISLFDVIAGFAVSMRTASREIAIDPMVENRSR